MTIEKVHLGAITQVLNGYAFKSNEYVDDGIRVIRITNVQKGKIQDDDPKFIAIHRRDEFGRFMLDDGDILISLTGNVGRVGVIKKSMLPAALNQRVGALKIESKSVDARYIFHILNSGKFEKDAIKNSKGVAQLNLSSKWVEKYEIPLPPLAEQKRIAGILDAADALRAKRRESLAQLDSLLQSSFLDLFGDPVSNPMGWERVGMTDAVVGKYGIKAGPFGSSLKKEDYTTSGYRVYGQEQVIGGRFDIGDYYIDERKYQQLKSCAVAEDDLLVSLVGSFGRVLAVPSGIEPGIINPRLLKITPNQQLVIPIFLSELLQHASVQGEFLRLAHGGTMGILNAGLLKQLKVILPPLPLQRRLAAIVESVERQKERQRGHLAELDALFAALQHRAFRGEL